MQKKGILRINSVLAYKNQPQSLNIWFPLALHWTDLLTSSIDLDDLSFLKKGQISVDRRKKKHFYKAIFHQLLLVPGIQQSMIFDDFRKENQKIDQYMRIFFQFTM